jgi:hypothetical protein
MRSRIPLLCVPLAALMACSGADQPTQANSVPPASVSSHQGTSGDTAWNNQPPPPPPPSDTAYHNDPIPGGSNPPMPPIDSSKG